MADYMKSQSGSRALAFIDPFGMAVNWESISAFSGGLGIDMWLLVPSGIGVNRLLTKKGDINDEWITKLEDFLGLSEAEIRQKFYTSQTVPTLFGDEEFTEKAEGAIDKIIELYSLQLKTIFKFVSKPFPMKNSQNSVMYHFLLATNNKTALKIGNDIIGKENENKLILMAQSSIEWTEMTWNPTTGCDKVICWLQVFAMLKFMSRRLQAMGVKKYRNNFKLSVHEDALLIPYGWKHPRVVFVNSMSDLFHEDVPLAFIQKVF